MAASVRSRALRTASVLSGALLVWLGIAAAGDAPSATRGEQLYYEHACYGCHGFSGQTGARDLVGTGNPIVENESMFLAFLRARGDVAPVLPSMSMPSYPVEALSDAEARDIFAYIQTFELDAPPLEDVPALKAIIELAREQSEP